MKNSKKNNHKKTNFRLNDLFVFRTIEKQEQKWKKNEELFKHQKENENIHKNESVSACVRKKGWGGGGLCTKLTIKRTLTHLFTWEEQE